MKIYFHNIWKTFSTYYEIKISSALKIKSSFYFSGTKGKKVLFACKFQLKSLWTVCYSPPLHQQ